MKIGNKSIKGLYKFKDGITFELDDILYYEGMLYTVIASTYNGDLTPDESPRCESFIEKLAGTDKLVTTNNLLSIINSIVDGLQMGGSISRITINALSELDNYSRNGVYSLQCSLFDSHPFESLLRVYSFTVENTKKILQEIINYSDLRELGQDTYPTNIWYRIGTIDGFGNINWGQFSSVVSAHNNAEYGLALENFYTADTAVKNTLSELNTKLNNATHYFLKKNDDDKYVLNSSRSGIINVIFTYTEDGETLQDNLTYDVSLGTNKAKSTAGKKYTITVTESNDQWLISFPNNINVLKVIELNV
jgi:hypothetical protein